MTVERDYDVVNYAVPPPASMVRPFIPLRADLSSSGLTVDGSSIDRDERESMEITAHRRSEGRRKWTRAWATLVAAFAMIATALVAVQPAAGADTPWLTISNTEHGVFVRWTVPNDAVTAATGGQATNVLVRGSFGPSDNWAQINLGRSGANWTEQAGPLEPGLYHYQLTADNSENFADTTNPNTNEIQPTWRWFYVPGPDGYFLNDVPEGAGGALHDLTYQSNVALAERKAVVYTPLGYDADRAEPYPVLYLQHGALQSFRDWTELGRAKQIFDNLVNEGKMVPTVVVMGNGNSSNFTKELLENIVPASRTAYNVSDDPSQMALAGLSMGGGQSMTVLKTNPGKFAYLGTFGAGFGSTAGIDVAAINAGTKLLRLYTGNPTDLAYNGVMTSIPALDAAGVNYEFDGINPDYGHNWNHWQESLHDFSQRLFQDVTDHGMSPGHLPPQPPFSTPPVGTTPTPWISDGYVTFETSTAFASAKTVTVWGNWGTSHNWTRIELSKRGDRWRGIVGQLDPGFYYYRLHVDGVQTKDTQNPTKVTSEPNWSTFFIPGESAKLLADVPDGTGGSIQPMTYQSTVANASRTAYVYTPPGYDPQRGKPYPVFYLQHGAGQNYTDWVEMGRAKQIFDNLVSEGKMVPSVVVMGNGNSQSFTRELLENIVPVSRQNYNVSEEPEKMALAGLSMGGGQTATVLKTNPGKFAYIGIFSAGFGSTNGVDAEAINDGTKLLRLYTGNQTDLAYNGVINSLSALDAANIKYQFNGVTEHGHNWDAWQQNLIDFSQRVFDPPNKDGKPVKP